jgi:UDP-glucose 4-epimerase
MISKVSIVAGGAGFIGVNLLPNLLSEGRSVVVLDNMSRGKESYVRSIPNVDQGRLSVFACDCTSRQSINEYIQTAENIGEVDEVWHLAANSDIPAGVLDANVDLRDTFMTTFELLQAMKRWSIPTLHFASSSAIYGDLGDATLHEGVGPLLPISNYGAMKLASEALASAASESYLKRVNLFRFPNVVGVPATHGVILDFVSKLLVTPNNLQVLGNGSQQKSYLHVSDLSSAMLTIRGRQVVGNVNVVNIGPVDQGVTVRWIAEQVVARVSPRAAIEFGQGNKGWVGDVPRFNYSTDRLQSYGWLPAMGSAAAITRAIDEIALQLGC